MNKIIAIKDIVDANKTSITSEGMTRVIGIDDLHEFCAKLEAILNYIPKEEANPRNFLATLITRIKVAYFCKRLQEGEKLTPISLQGNMLVDGRRRLWAHILNGDTEVEYINVK